ncbi:MAG TPA: MBG domain-containing protein [Planctomycetota bacterium]
MKTTRIGIFTAVLLALATEAAWGAADDHWASGFTVAGADRQVNALAVDGNGNLYAGGMFVVMHDKVVNYVAKWDGSSWSPLGSGMNDAVWALAVDGSGNVYAGGDFTTAGGVSANYVAKWNGSSWSALGSGMNLYGSVYSLSVDGSGSVYAGGRFTAAGGVSANRIAKWDGSSWSALGSGMNNSVNALTVDASGSVYAGGGFTTAGGVSANCVAKWNGSAWSALGTGMGGSSPYLKALVLDGSSNLYAGGSFTTAGAVGANNIAKWNGSSWSALGSGMNSSVIALAMGGASNMYAAGWFATAGGVSVHYVAKWNGSSWSALGSGTSGSGLSGLAVDGGGNVYVGGVFPTAGNASACNIAKWNGSSWSALGTGTNDGFRVVAVDDNGNVYAGGDFTMIGGVSANYVARWDGTSWTALGSGMNGEVSALLFDGSGNLYAGGWFSKADGVTVNYIAKWNGFSWSALGTGMGAQVYALAMDAGGNLYAGGWFTTAGGVSANRVAKWNGSSWSALGSGVTGGTPSVNTLVVDNSGSVYAGGGFTTAGSVSANGVARWDGFSWSALGVGMGASSPSVCTLVLDGSGNLYAGGNFTTAGGVSANNAAKWNGSSWSALGSGMAGSSPYVYALAMDGAGSLYAAGRFTTAGGMSANNIAKWNGSSWSPLGSGIRGYSPVVFSLATDNSGSVYAGGAFGTAGGKVSCYFAKWYNTSPTNAVLPAVSGTYVVGNTLNATTGTWSDAEGDTLTYSYQWLRADDEGGTKGAPISGATTNTYTLTGADPFKYISMRVTVDDGYGGKTEAQSAYVVCPGPLGQFALTLCSPQVNGVAFTGTNTLTAQDVNGNTVKTFDASADPVTVTANAPLTGTVSGLGSGSDTTIDRAGDFVNGVANLTALGITFTGNETTGTFTAASASGKTGTSGSVSVIGGPAATLVVAGFPVSIVSGTAGSFTVTAKDAVGDVATGYVGSIHFSSDAAASLPANYTFVPADNGVHSFSATLKTVGTHAITATDTVTGTITGAQAGISVSPRAITVSAASDSKTYDGTTSSAVAPAITSGSLAAGDSATWTQTFDNRNVGRNKTLAPSGTVNDGNGSNNYSITFVNDTSGEIKAKTLTVSGIGASDKVYDGTRAVALTGAPGSLNGVVGTDDVSLAGIATGTFADANVGGGKAVSVSGLSLTGTQAGNYSITEPSTTATITPRPMTVTADAKGKVYADADPALTYQITGGSLAAGEQLTGSLSRIAGENAGTYAIQQGTLTAGANYDFTYIGANLAINARGITVTANAKSKVYGDADPAMTYQITGGSLAAGEQLTGSLSRIAGENAGTYAIQQGTLTAGANYDFTYIGANLAINSRGITVTADAKSKVYGDADPALTYQITSGTLVSGDRLTGRLTRPAGEDAGTYPISQGTLSASGNYSLVFGESKLTIAKADQAITFGALPAKTEGDADFDPGAMAASKLAVCYFSSDTNVSTIANGKIHLVGVGSCTITASQTGDANWNAAPNVQQVLNVMAGVAPRITSPLTATATRGSSFSYQLAASGSTPLTFAAANLPPGLAFSGDTISGTPTAAGVARVTLRATNRFGLDTQTLQVTISRPSGAAETPPALESHPSAELGVTGSTISFSASAADAEDDQLDYSWDFGDGSTGSGATTSHIYPSAGVYTVTLTVSDGAASATQKMDIVVGEAAAPPGTDDGGDPSWAEGTNNAFVISKGSVKFTFTNGSKDALRLLGTLPVNKFFKPQDRKVTVLMGDLKKEFTLNAKGRGTSGGSSFKMSGKMKNGVFKATPAKFSLTVKGEPLLNKFETFGFDDLGTYGATKPINISVIIMVDPLAYEASKTFQYKATAGKIGTAK